MELQEEFTNSERQWHQSVIIVILLQHLKSKSTESGSHVGLDYVGLI